jgi:hypothetical protein
MSSDRYLKAVLTIIAGCLVYICLALTAWPAASADELTRCVIIGWEGRTAGGVRSYNLPGGPSGPSAPIPVTP